MNSLDAVMVGQRVKRVVQNLLQLSGVIALLVLALHSGFDRPASAQIRQKTEPRQAFKSGGARSELVLREISATLKQIDARLERLEKIAAKH